MPPKQHCGIASLVNMRFGRFGRFGRFALLALFVKCVKHTSVATETIDPFNIFDQQLGLNPNAQTFTPSTVVDTNTINNNDGNKSKRRRKKTRAQKKAS